jgi:hypothetical protein
VGDFKRDSKADIAGVNTISKCVSVLPGNGDGKILSTLVNGSP